MSAVFSERCTVCDAPVEIVAEDASGITVWCSACDTTYGMEKVAGAGGSVEYWPLFRIVLTGEDYEDADQSQSATVHKVA